MLALRDAMIKIDASQFVYNRELTDKGDNSDWRTYYYSNQSLEGYEIDDDEWSSGVRYFKGNGNPVKADPYEGSALTRERKYTLSNLVKMFPEETADMLEEMGYDTQNFLEELHQRSKG
jgi:hypothetical protein